MKYLLMRARPIQAKAYGTCTPEYCHGDEVLREDQSSDKVPPCHCHLCSMSCQCRGCLKQSERLQVVGLEGGLR